MLLQGGGGGRSDLPHPQLHLRRPGAGRALPRGARCSRWSRGDLKADHARLLLFTKVKVICLNGTEEVQSWRLQKACYNRTVTEEIVFNTSTRYLTFIFCQVEQFCAADFLLTVNN